MKLSYTTRIAILTFGTFLVYWVLDDLYFNGIRSYLIELLGIKGVGHIVAYFISSLPILIGLRVIHGKWSFPAFLGLNGNPLNALVFSLVATAPMFIGYFFVFDVNPGISLDQVLISVIAAGFFEEVFFRGFLFGQLYGYTKFGFIPAIILCALLFGVIHLYQSHDVLSAIGIFGITFMAAILFGWLYVEWANNLWVPIFAHSLMNLSWLLFSVDNSALGGWYANLFRIITVILLVLLTIYSKSFRGGVMVVNKKTLWMKK